MPNASVAGEAHGHAGAGGEPLGQARFCFAEEARLGEVEVECADRAVAGDQRADSADRTPCASARTPYCRHRWSLAGSSIRTGLPVRADDRARALIQAALQLIHLGRQQVRTATVRGVRQFCR